MGRKKGKCNNLAASKINLVHLGEAERIRTCCSEICANAVQDYLEGRILMQYLFGRRGQNVSRIAEPIIEQFVVTAMGNYRRLLGDNHRLTEEEFCADAVRMKISERIATARDAAEWLLYPNCSSSEIQMLLGSQYAYVAERRIKAVIAGDTDTIAIVR